MLDINYVETHTTYFPQVIGIKCILFTNICGCLIYYISLSITQWCFGEIECHFDEIYKSQKQRAFNSHLDGH